MNALSSLWAKFTRSKKYREAFVAAQLKRGIPSQIRVLRRQRGWSQADLAKAAGLTQGAMSRAEDPDYGNLTLNNVLKIASGLDVGFMGRFVTFSELARWQASLSEEALQVPSFAEDSIGVAQQAVTGIFDAGYLTGSSYFICGATTLNPYVGYSTIYPNTTLEISEKFWSEALDERKDQLSMSTLVPPALHGPQLDTRRVA